MNQRQLYTRVLDPGKGQLVFLVTLTPCSGASISDQQSAPLENPKTYQKTVEQYVSITSGFFNVVTFFHVVFCLYGSQTFFYCKVHFVWHAFFVWPPK